MKNFENTATASWLLGEKIKTVYSNRVILPFISRENCVKGEIFCRNGCEKWSLVIREKAGNQAVFSLQGCTPKDFCVPVDNSKQYCISFFGDEKSTMRLYAVPDNVQLACEWV